MSLIYHCYFRANPGFNGVMTVTGPKMNIFKFKRADGRHVENHFLGHNSAGDWPISVKCCVG